MNYNLSLCKYFSDLVGVWLVIESARPNYNLKSVSMNLYSSSLVFVLMIHFQQSIKNQMLLIIVPYAESSDFIHG